MGLFHAYRPITENIDKTKIGRLLSLNYGNNQLELSTYNIFFRLEAGDIRSPQIRTHEGIVNFNLGSRLFEPNLYSYDVDFGALQNPERVIEGMAGIAAYNVRSKDGKFSVARDIEVNGRRIGYDVDVFIRRRGEAVLAIRLPQNLTKIDRTTDGFAYRRLPRTERSDLMKEDIEPIIQDSMGSKGNGCGFFNKARRVDGRCITQFCPEPREVNKKELTRIFEKSLDMDGETKLLYSDIESGGYPSYRNHSWQVALSNSPLRLQFTYKANILHESIFHDIFYERLGLSIPQDSEISYEKRYMTLAGEGMKRFREFLGELHVPDVVGSIGRAVASPYVCLSDYFDRIIDERREQREERDSRVKEWLQEYATPNQRSFDSIIEPERFQQGCVIFVDPVCEMEVREGKKLGEEKVTSITE